MLGFKSYRTAAVTLAGIELAHRTRKRQFQVRAWSVDLLVAEKAVGQSPGMNSAACRFRVERARFP